MMKSRSERILDAKKVNQKKVVRRSAGLLNTSIVLASLAVPSFSVLASAEENASSSQRAIEAVVDSSVDTSSTVSSATSELPQTSEESSADSTATSEASSNSESSTASSETSSTDSTTNTSESSSSAESSTESSSSESSSEATSEAPEVETPDSSSETPVVEQPSTSESTSSEQAPADSSSSSSASSTTPVTPKVEVETDRPFTKEEVTDQNIAEVQVPEANHHEAEKIMFVKNQSTQEFIDKISKLAAEIGADKDLYASVMIAQAILESGSGNSSLSSEPNYNLFGIKGTFEDQSVSMLTLEDDGSGNYYQITGEFRKYPSYKESLEDYAKLLTGGTSFNADFYSGTWKSNTTSYKDATTFLTGKYATDTQYAEKLNQLIETYDLTQFDNGVADKDKETKDVTYKIVSGDTLWDIGNTYDISVQELMEMNKLSSDLIFVNQEIVVKKAEKTEAVATVKKEEVATSSTTKQETKQAAPVKTADTTKKQAEQKYTVVEGDSLSTIAKKYNVSPKEIKTWNGMKNNLLFIGQTLTIKA